MDEVCAQLEALRQELASYHIEIMELLNKLIESEEDLH